MYLAFKHSHMLFVVISGLLFLVRGAWMMMDSGRLQKKWVRVLPHVNDTLLLLTAIVLCVLTQQYPVAQSWLTVKVVALVIYIGLGVVALRTGKTKTVRTLAWLAALLVFLYTFSVARAHHPLGFFAALA
ncbi:MAG: regulator SirB [Pseudomonadales bacterium]|nr:regulator SirB [Pseudomonadales bacterium]